MRDSTAIDVLLIEDNAADIYLIQRAIADCSPHIRLWLVSTGTEAMAFLRQEAPFPYAPLPALILLDLHLPGTKGYELLPKLRGLPAYQTTPVIVVSGSERGREEARCLQLGANAYVQKSSDFDTYFASIQTIIWNWLGADGTLP